MDTALEEYTRAYACLLDWCKQNLATIEVDGKYRDRYSETSVRKLMPKRAQLNRFNLHGSCYDSLLVDVSGVVTSYLQRRQQDPGTSFPTCRDPDPRSFPNALEEFAAVLLLRRCVTRPAPRQAVRRKGERGDTQSTCHDLERRTSHIC